METTNLPLNENGAPQEPRKKSNRGFASMSEERKKEISSLGGRTAHKQGVAHKWNSEEARAAGRKGGANRYGRNQQSSGHPND
jgi:uncharacterized protein